ncbi:MAG: class I SAM-dependent methyltransferase, partial [Gammaproteobacteria bacterium]|nr:class I SAM-dependent methyltransferase [Gammaproteobacteria bacterium]
LEHDIVFSDASAYNVQFDGANPMFIDLLSLRRYREGEYWIGYGQFCEQFLNPLLLRVYLGLPHNAWFRGSFEGIPAGELACMLPVRARFSWRVLIHVIGLARMQASALSNRENVIKVEKRMTSRGLSRLGYTGLLQQLRNWIEKLDPLDVGKTVWGEYEQTHTYDEEEMRAKQGFVRDFVERTGVKCVADFGCNTGAFSELACRAGAERVIVFEYDRVALEKAYQRAVTGNLKFTPLYLDAANPSPSQGWRQSERLGLEQRGTFDAILALAFEHHLAIGRNIPLPDVVKWLVDRAPRGVIEFVQKDDPTVKQMLTLREDIFDAYSQDVFEQALANHARIEKAQKISREGRMLYWYERD